MIEYLNKLEGDRSYQWPNQSKMIDNTDKYGPYFKDTGIKFVLYDGEEGNLYSDGDLVAVRKG